MHLRGRDMTFKAHYPDGKSETLLIDPQLQLRLADALRWEPGKKHFPKGTRLECIAHYDNSAFNPYNPDPKATVRDGQQTHHEMMNGFFFYVRADEKLNLDIDGKTGHVTAEATACESLSRHSPTSAARRAVGIDKTRGATILHERTGV